MRQPIFQGKSEGDQLFAIFKVLGSPSQEEYNELSSMVPFDPKIFKEFKNYKLNTTFFEEQFSYIKDYKNLMDLLLKMFNYIPSKRITALEALKHPFFADVADTEIVE
jgi:serine/threonine protein kinase